MSAPLKELQVKISSIKGRITKFKNLIKRCSESVTLDQVDVAMLGQRLEAFRELNLSFQELQTELELVNSANLDTELDNREEIENDFSYLIVKASILIEKKYHKH